jgi:hypothetical protein
MAWKGRRFGATRMVEVCTQETRAVQDKGEHVAKPLSFAPPDVRLPGAAARRVWAESMKIAVIQNPPLGQFELAVAPSFSRAPSHFGPSRIS